MRWVAPEMEVWILLMKFIILKATTPDHASLHKVNPFVPNKAFLYTFKTSENIRKPSTYFACLYVFLYFTWMKCKYISIYIYKWSKVVWDTQSARISQKQDERNLNAIMTGRVHCFHDCIYIYTYIYIYITHTHTV